MNQEAKKELAELLALHTATTEVDHRITQAARTLHDHHQTRLEHLRPLATQPGREDDLPEEYAESLRERDAAARGLREG